MARAWQEHGKSMARAWQEHGKRMARAWQGHGMSRSGPSRSAGRIRIPLPLVHNSSLPRCQRQYSLVSCFSAMSHSAAASSGADLQPQPQRGALDVVTMNVGAKSFENVFSQPTLLNLQELAQEFRIKARAATIKLFPSTLRVFKTSRTKLLLFLESGSSRVGHYIILCRECR